MNCEAERTLSCHTIYMFLTDERSDADSDCHGDINVEYPPYYRNDQVEPVDDAKK